MSQIVLNIHDESLKDRILWFLSCFKSEDIEIQERQSTQEETIYSEEYIEKNWRKLALGTKSDDAYYKSEQYYEDRFEDYQQGRKV